MSLLSTLAALLPKRLFPGLSVFEGPVRLESVKNAAILATDADGNVVQGQGPPSPLPDGDADGEVLTWDEDTQSWVPAAPTWGDSVNVVDYGAIPNDPAKGTDNDTAFAAALATGKAVYVPTGTWTLASNLTLIGSQKIYGDGVGSVIGTNLDVSESATATNCTANDLAVSGNATATNCTATNDLEVYGNATATNCTATNNLKGSESATATNCTATNNLSVSGNATATNCTAKNLSVSDNARLFGGSIAGNTNVSNTTNARLIGVRFSSAEVFLKNNTGLKRIGCVDVVAPTFTGPSSDAGWENVEDTNKALATLALGNANAAIINATSATELAQQGVDDAATAQSTADTAANLAADTAAYAGTIDTKATNANNKADTNATNLTTLTADFNFATKNITDFVASSVWSTTGAIASNASFKRTAKYRTQKDAQFKVPAGQTGTVAQAVFWKSDGTLLSTVQNQTGVIIAPANAYYVAFSVLNTATDIKVQGGFWSLQQQDANLLFEYVHSGNKEVNITSVDYATNTFTAPAHGLVNSTNAVLTSRVGLALNNTQEVVIPQNVTPFSSYPTAGFFVVNATANTFQLSLTEGGAPVALTNKGGTVDLTKWHIEQGGVHSIRAELEGARFRTLIEGGICLAYSNYVGVTGQQVFYRDGGTGANYNNTNAIPTPCFGRVEALDVNANSGQTGSKLVQVDVVQFNAADAKISVVSARGVIFTRAPWPTTFWVGMQNMLLANGTTIRIYKY